MKRCNRVAALLLCAVCLFLTGCAGEQPTDSTGNTECSTGQTLQKDPTESQAAPNDHTDATQQTDADPQPTDPTTPAETKPEQTVPASESTSPDPTVPRVPEPDDTEDTELQILAAGKKRITYTVNISSVRYVTSPSALPDYPELAGYDDAWFRDHALVLVYETVASGTVAVDINHISVRDGAASVALTHEAQSGLGTADMTTWVLWAEVESGLDYSWSVENPAMDSDVSDH